jgi:predicted transcriptional regulator
MASEIAGFTDKEIALESLRQMPDQVSLQEICDELAILAAIRRAEADEEAGRLLTHEEVVRRSSEWISP